VALSRCRFGPATNMSLPYEHFSSLVEAGIVQDYFALPPPVFTAPPKTTTAALRATTR
jgi:hypothetical protein